MDGQPDSGEHYTGNLAPPQQQEQSGYEPEPEYGYGPPEGGLYDEEGYPVELGPEGYEEEEAYAEEGGLDLTGPHEHGTKAWNDSIDALEQAHPALQQQEVAEAFLDHALENAYALTGDEAAAQELSTNPEYLHQLAEAAGPQLQQARSLESEIDAYQAEKTRRREAF